MDIQSLTSIITTLLLAGSVFWAGWQATQAKKQVKIANEQVKQALNAHRENHLWNRRIEAQRFLDSYNRLESVFNLDEEFHFTTKTEPIEIAVLQDKLNGKRNLRLQLLRLLNYYESLAIGLKMKIYDEKIVRETRMASMIKTYITFKRFIESEQEKNPSMYLYFRERVEAWSRESHSTTEEKTMGS